MVLISLKKTFILLSIQIFFSLAFDSRVFYESIFCVEKSPCKFYLVADLDLKSRPINPGEKNYRSFLQKGEIYKDENNKYVINWEAAVMLLSGYNEYGRGMELSELVYFDGKMLAGDDRSGILFEIKQDGKFIVPKHVLSEGDGNKSKGMKIEWASIRDEELWVGSFGKEFTNNQGEIKKQDNMWVVSIDKTGNIRHYNWSDVYNLIRKELNVEFPGYCIHEAVNWSPYLRKWIFLPRKVSKLPYNDLDDEKRGSNHMVILSDDLSKVDKVVRVGEVVPERGYSSFKFLPGSNDYIMVALKTVENSKDNQQLTYITVFNLDGDILLNDTIVPGEFKYEGIEFTNRNF